MNKPIKSNYDACLLGLHACADLTIDAIKLFLNLERCKGLVIMPCCYHKMKMKESGVEEFLNIPLSDSLRLAYEKCHAGGFMRRPFLRLCCQRVTWTENEQNTDVRAFHLLSRAVLQLFAHRGLC